MISYQDLFVQKTGHAPCDIAGSSYVACSSRPVIRHSREIKSANGIIIANSHAGGVLPDIARGGLPVQRL